MSTLRVNNMTNVGGTGPTYASGMVIQTVNFVQTTGTSTTSTSYVDNNLSLTITPTKASSKILVLVTLNGIYKSAGNQYNAANFRLLRDSTQLNVFGNSVGFTNATTYTEGLSASIAYMDTPGTTSALTYKTQFNSNNGVSVVVGGGSSAQTITLMEIAG